MPPVKLTVLYSMISRRLLRVKVLQVLYANHSKENQSINSSENELFLSINKSYDLYHLCFLLLIEMVRQAETRIDMLKEKHIPTPDDLNPNTRFTENKLIAKLRANQSLNRYLAEKKVSWVNQPELIGNLYAHIREQPYFIEYMQKPQSVFSDDKTLACNIIENTFAVNEDLCHTLEEMSIFWNDDLDFILSMAIKTIKNIKETDLPETPLMPLYKNNDDLEFVKNLFRKVALNQSNYGEMIKKYSKNWDFDRIALIDVLLMEMALAEFLECPSIPIKVTLNEYIELAKDYSTANSRVFINGMLDNLIQELKKENKIVKIGRGLIGEEAKA